MDQAIRIQVIVFPMEFGANPLPYVPAFCEWNDHVTVCVQCAHVDQLARLNPPADPEESEKLVSLLCEGGAHLQLTVDKRIKYQHEISMRN